MMDSRITTKMKQFGYRNEDAIMAVFNYCEKKNETSEFLSISNNRQMLTFVNKAIRWQGEHGGFRGTTTIDVFANKHLPKSTIIRNQRTKAISKGLI